MRDEFDESFEGARSKQRAKRRKTNIILNSLIGIVIVLIVFVAITIFSGGNKEKAEPEKQEPNNEQVSGDENKSSSDENKEEKENNQDEQQATVTTDEGESAATEGEEEAELIVEEGTNPNVRKTIINPAWKPVGTEQTGVHETKFDMESVDWKEMEMALAYGAGLDHGNMTTWFIANGGPNQAIGTVSAKDGQQAYRVYIQWVDEQGWKPTKVEELIENDKGQGTRNRES